MNVNPGELNKRIKFIKFNAEKDKDGFETQTEVVIKEVWAKFSRKSIKQINESNTEAEETKVRFLVRYLDVLKEFREYIFYDNHYYKIEYPNDYEDRHQYIEFAAVLVR